jgi:hypothetical protein
MAIHWAWKTKLLQVEADKAQRDHASECFASTCPGCKRFGASTDEVCRVAGLSITKSLMNAQADVEEAVSASPSSKGLNQGVWCKPLA